MPEPVALQMVDDEFQAGEHSLAHESLEIAADALEDAARGGVRLNWRTLNAITRITKALQEMTE